MSKLDQTSLIVCFRRSGTQDAWIQSQAVRIITSSNTALTLGAAIPDALPDDWWPQRLFETASASDSTLLGMVPLAAVRVTGTNAAGARVMDAPLTVGVTRYLASFLFAVLMIVVAFVAVDRFARHRNIPGTNPLLRVITTPSGVASLSQMQIMLWSFVVGGSAIYVMALSGSMIDITTGTLALLGITGIATVGSKIKANTDAATAAAASPLTAPGAPAALALMTPATDSVVRLTWPPPTTGGTASFYTVQYRLNAGPGPWVTARSSLATTSSTIIGLSQATAYDFQVIGANAVSAGPAVALTNVTTAAAPPAGGLGGVFTLTATALPGGTQVLLSWTAAPAAAFQPQYRRHDSDEDWTAAPHVTQPNAAIPRLAPYTDYDVRVLALNPATGALGAPSPIITVRTAASQRTPQWSDLVISDGGHDIDVTRVQMLFFTVVSAIFVTLRVLTSNVIPEIPEGFVLLMGISNGVYLTSKFTG
jgi:hypothetical protein